jgi:hypothetical protein
MAFRPGRREFISSTGSLLGGGWLWLNLPALAALSGCAREAARRADPFTHFTAAQGRTVRAFTARIIPSGEGVPGADEAGAAWFIDGILQGPMADAAELVAGGLADLDTRARAEHDADFADLEADRQDRILREIEETEFFGAMRFFTLMGTFAGDDLGGNREHAGYTLLQIDHRPGYQPPFGWYDERHAREDGGAA